MVRTHINYEDNIFILNAKIRSIDDLMRLEAESALFLDKTMEDIDFIGDAAGKILANLLENKQLIDWDDQLYNLYDTEDHFSALLRGMLNGQAVFSVSKHPAITGMVSALADASATRQKKIKENMRDPGQATNDPRVVSVEELSLLVG
jgi:hypothetical protein